MPESLFADSLTTMTQATAKEAEAQHAEATATAIDSAGDLILELGQTDVKTHLRVSSKALALASPVFAAMVSSRFSEGNELAKGSLRPIPLPEDDPEAVTLLCNILHFRSRLVPARIPFPLLEKLALVCDKYDTAGAVTPWSTLWFQQWVGSLTGEDRYAKVLCLSYAYDNRKAFYEASSNFLQYTADSTVEDSMEGPSLVPDPLIGGFISFQSISTR